MRKCKVALRMSYDEETDRFDYDIIRPRWAFDNIDISPEDMELFHRFNTLCADMSDDDRREAFQCALEFCALIMWEAFAE